MFASFEKYKKSWGISWQIFYIYLLSFFFVCSNASGYLLVFLLDMLFFMYVYSISFFEFPLFFILYYRKYLYVVVFFILFIFSWKKLLFFIFKKFFCLTFFFFVSHQAYFVSCFICFMFMLFFLDFFFGFEYLIFFFLDFFFKRKNIVYYTKICFFEKLISIAANIHILQVSMKKYVFDVFPECEVCVYTYYYCLNDYRSISYNYSLVLGNPFDWENYTSYEYIKFFHINDFCPFFFLHHFRGKFLFNFYYDNVITYYYNF